MKLTTELFISKAKEIHGSAYNYDKVSYTDTKTHVIITCPTHGDFIQTPHIHLHRKIGCRVCGRLKASTGRRVGQDEFVRRAIAIHGDKYDYSRVKYVNNNTKVEMICPLHGSFFIRPTDIEQHNQGCKQCGVMRSSTTRSWSRSEFVKQSTVAHNGVYTYNNVADSFTSNTKVEITCPTHGSFWMLPGNHLHNKQGCYQCHCVMSRPERMICQILDDLKIQYIKQKRFNQCRSAKGFLLRYDFYIPSHNLLIEYDGEQHFLPIRGQSNLTRTQTHDDIKTKYANENGIRLLRIPFFNKDSCQMLIEQALVTNTYA